MTHQKHIIKCREKVNTQLNWLFILKKEMDHNFPALSFYHMLTSKVILSLIV